MIIVHFEDHGQDFLRCSIEDGVVVDCQPFQAWLWNGTKVLNADIKPGDILEIIRTGSTVATLNYPVERVEEK